MSNLPTVWSNCLAGWLLGGGGPFGAFLALCLGSTAVYLGGMFLNDAMDVDFDRATRAGRPIPAGEISETRVWQWGYGLLAFGTTTLALLGWTSFVFAVLLALAALAYNLIHKRTPLGVLLIAGCRFLLYLVAASAATEGIRGMAVWCGLVLALYVAGLSFVARNETLESPAPWWPVLFLAAPVLLAWVANDGIARERAFSVSLVLTVWVLPFVHHLLRRPPASPAFTVSGLLAGIIIVDFLAVAGMTLAFLPPFGALFCLALFAQRHVPAT
ncbi:MAG: UbiA family prenyltransferase [Verrucomicrobiae bacterium]|nr:UbiA family prenyltransferase [Verrucomicrobiae bacterium]